MQSALNERFILSEYKSVLLLNTQIGPEQLHGNSQQNKAKDLSYHTNSYRPQQFFEKTQIFKTKVNENEIEDDPNYNGQRFVLCTQRKQSGHGTGTGNKRKCNRNDCRRFRHFIFMNFNAKEYIVNCVYFFKITITISKIHLGSVSSINCSNALSIHLD